MDNKPLSHLDPKMQERYAQIMGKTDGAPQGDAMNAAPSTESVQNTAEEQPMNPQASETLPQPGQFSQDLAAVPESNTEPQAPTDSPFFNNSESPTEEAPVAEAYQNDQTASPEVDTMAAEPETQTAPIAAETSAPSNMGASASPSPFSKPLPSPADLAQNGPKETSALLKVLYIVGAVVFFMIYTIFWIKVFNLPFIF